MPSSPQPPAPAALDSRRRRRNEYISLLRIASAFGIVWFHAQAPFGYLGGIGLVVFLVLMGCFAAGSDYERTRPVSVYARRLLQPWALWFFVFALLNAIRGEAILPIEDGFIVAVLKGPASHLWYLPFAFAALVALEFAKRLPRWWTLIGAASVSVVLILLLPVLEPVAATFGAPWTIYVYAIVLTLVGVTLGASQYLPRVGLPLIALTMLAIVVAAVTFAQKEIVLVGLIGIGLVLGAICLDQIWPLTIGLDWLAKAMLGVYLIHPLMIGVAYKLVPDGAGRAILAFGLSTALVTTWQGLFAIGRGLSRAMREEARAGGPPGS